MNLTAASAVGTPIKKLKTKIESNPKCMLCARVSNHLFAENARYVSYKPKALSGIFTLNSLSSRILREWYYFNSKSLPPRRRQSRSSVTKNLVDSWVVQMSTCRELSVRLAVSRSLARQRQFISLTETDSLNFTPINMGKTSPNSLFCRLFSWNWCLS